MSIAARESFPDAERFAQFRCDRTGGGWGHIRLSCREVQYFYDPKTKEDLRGVGMLLVAKNRNGATGIANSATIRQ